MRESKKKSVGEGLCEIDFSSGGGHETDRRKPLGGSGVKVAKQYRRREEESPVV